MRTMCSREIFTKICRQQQIFDSHLKGAWHYNHVTFTPIAKNFMVYCTLIYTLSILCIRLRIKEKVGIPESFKVGWYRPSPRKLGRVTLTMNAKLTDINFRQCGNNLRWIFERHVYQKAPPSTPWSQEAKKDPV